MSTLAKVKSITHHNHAITSCHYIHTLLEHISSLVLMKQIFTVTIQDGTDSKYTFNIKVLLQLIEQCAYMHISNNSTNTIHIIHICRVLTELTTL